MFCLVQLLPSNLSTTLPTPKLLQGFESTFHEKNGSKFGALYQPLVDSIENIITVWLRTILPRSFAYKRFIVHPKLLDVQFFEMFFFISTTPPPVNSNSIQVLGVYSSSTPLGCSVHHQNHPLGHPKSPIDIYGSGTKFHTDRHLAR